MPLNGAVLVLVLGFVLDVELVRVLVVVVAVEGPDLAGIQSIHLK